MRNNSKSHFNFIISFMLGGRCLIKLKAIMLIFITTAFQACEKDTDTGLNPLYGPTVTKQFGEVTANVQELSFRSNGFSIVDVMRHTTIPILLFFGELDKNVDPVQGAQAYKAALQQSGNQNYMIRVLEGAGHVLAPAITGCFDEHVPAEYVPEYLDMLSNWINDQNP